MKTNEIIAGLRKLCGQGTEYRRTVCRLAADTLEAQQKRIEELENEQGKALTAFLSPIDAYQGLKRKYLVFKSDTGEMVENCFVLRPGEDPAAVEALRAYARTTDNATLSADIVNWVGEGEEHRWIPVAERRPTDADTDDKRGYGCVEVYSPSSGVDVASVDWVNDFVNDVTHWRPLPQPPKEDA